MKPKEKKQPSPPVPVPIPCGMKLFVGTKGKKRLPLQCFSMEFIREQKMDDGL